MLFLGSFALGFLLVLIFLDLQIASTLVHHYITRSQASAQTATATARLLLCNNPSLSAIILPHWSGVFNRIHGCAVMQPFSTWQP